MPGYFDAIKQQKQPPAEPGNVTPIHRTVSDGIHPYARAAIDAELARLDQCRVTPIGHAPGWDDTTYEVACNLLEIANSPWSGYTRTQAWNDLNARAPRDPGFDQRRIDAKWASAEGKVAGAGRPQPSESDPLPDVTVLDLTPAQDDAFWDARKALRHLHDFARARRVSPWAVLGVALARVVAATPHQVCLPPIIGSKASLNLFVGLVGPSGSGKGAAEAVAADALHVGYLTVHNVGSGEGIAHGYMHRSKGVLEWNDDTHAVLFSVPEIDSLAAQGDRKGATLMPQLRSGWTGEQLGFGYADPTKRIIVPGHEYRLCLVAGIQPGRAGCLLDDADGGTPQRFLWLPATDPQAPEHAPLEPSPLTWEAPPTGSLASIGGIRITVCELARDTIRTNRLAQLRGKLDALDGHALLAQLKTAAALGILDGRYSVTDEDWWLADVIARKSAAVRARVQETLKAKAKEVNQDKAEAEAHRAVHVAEKVEDAAIRRACQTVTRKLRREGEPMTSGALRRSLAGKDRGHFDAAIERLLEAGSIESETGGKGVRYRLAAKQ